MSYELLGSVINNSSISASLGTDDYFGWDCSISDDGTKIIGVALENPGLGHIAAFKYENGDWVAYGNELRGPEDAVGSSDRCLSHSVQFNSDGTKFISGHPLWETGTTQSDQNDREGCVMVKEYNSSSDQWDAVGPTLITVLPLHENGSGDIPNVDRFGEMVSCNADMSRIVIGARYSDFNGGNRGAVFTYEYRQVTQVEWDVADSANLILKDGALSRNESKYWVLIGSESANALSGGTTADVGVSLVGTSNNDLFGSAVDMNSTGTRIVVGIANEDENGSNSGMVKVFQYNSGTDKWEQLGNDISGDNSGTDDSFGYRVCMNKNGSRFAALARRNGYAKCYEYNTSSLQWDLMGSNFSINSSQSGSDQRFVSLTDDGDVLAIGHAADNFLNVYKWDGSSNWNRVGVELNASNYGSIDSNTAFGSSGRLSKYGDFLVVGSTKVGASNTGQIQVFHNSSLAVSTSDVTHTNVTTAVSHSDVKSAIRTELSNSGISVILDDISATTVLTSYETGTDFNFSIKVENATLDDLSPSQQTSLIDVLKTEISTQLSVDSARLSFTLSVGSIVANGSVTTRIPFFQVQGSGFLLVSGSGHMTVSSS